MHRSNFLFNFSIRIIILLHKRWTATDFSMVYTLLSVHSYHASAASTTALKQNWQKNEIEIIRQKTFSIKELEFVYVIVPFFLHICFRENFEFLIIKCSRRTQSMNEMVLTIDDSRMFMHLCSDCIDAFHAALLHPFQPYISFISNRS